MGTHRVGDVVAFTIRRGTQTLVEKMKTAGIGTGKDRKAIVGIGTEQALNIHLPLQVRINAGSVGGPSAGVAFALDVMEELGRDVVHGHKIAATGEIRPDRLDRPDRRDQAEDDRRARGACGRLPRAGWGQRTGSAQVRTRPPDHPCGHLSTGVARLGDTRSDRVGRPSFRHVGSCRKVHVFRLDKPFYRVHRGRTMPSRQPTTTPFGRTP